VRTPDRNGAPLIGAAFPDRATHPVACDCLLESFVEASSIITTQQSPVIAAMTGLPTRMTQPNEST
jgi:hypothetical protein